MQINPRDLKLYVLAGTGDQAKSFAYHHRLPKESWEYIVSNNTFIGTHGGTYIKIGTWYERKDAREIMEYLKLCDFAEISLDKFVR